MEKEKGYYIESTIFTNVKVNTNNSFEMHMKCLYICVTEKSTENSFTETNRLLHNWPSHTLVKLKTPSIFVFDSKDPKESW